MTSCLSHPADEYFFKVKTRNIILICYLWPKSTIKTPEWCHAVFISNFEHIEQINFNFLSLTLSMYLSVRHRIKSTKKLKCTLNNEAVSLKTCTCDMSKSTWFKEPVSH